MRLANRACGGDRLFDVNLCPQGLSISNTGDNRQANCQSFFAPTLGCTAKNDQYWGIFRWEDRQEITRLNYITGCPMIWRFFIQGWVIIFFAYFLPDWAAIVKTAARNRVYRFCNTTFNIRFFAAPGWIGDRHCGKQCFRVGVQWIGQDLLRVTHFNNLS
jgi:hypothetical protein